MDNRNEIQSLLEKKLSLLEQFEQAARCLQICDAEQVDEHMNTRQSCIEQIDKIDREINLLTGSNPKGKEIAEIIKNMVDAADLPEEWNELSETAKQIFAVLNRIQRADIQVLANLEDQKKILLKKIKATNQSAEAQVSKYYNRLVPQQSSGSARFGKA